MWMTKIIMYKKEYILQTLNSAFNNCFKVQSLPSTKFSCVENEIGIISKGFNHCVLNSSEVTY